MQASKQATSVTFSDRFVHISSVNLICTQCLRFGRIAPRLLVLFCCCCCFFIFALHIRSMCILMFASISNRVTRFHFQRSTYHNTRTHQCIPIGIECTHNKSKMKKRRDAGPRKKEKHPVVVRIDREIERGGGRDTLRHLYWSVVKLP